MKLLIVEDDTNLSQALVRFLKPAGYVADTANNGVDGLHLAENESYDALILDLGLPQLSGLELLKRLRQQQNNVPVLILTARDAWHERVDGLKAGADDYLGKPFHQEELLARLNAILRRHHGLAEPMLVMAGIHLNTHSHQAFTAQGELISLSALEYRLLRYMMLNPDQVLSKTQLSEHIYQEEQLRDSNVIEVYINKLRQYFDQAVGLGAGKATILTHRGQGYRLVSQPDFQGESHLSQPQVQP